MFIHLLFPFREKVPWEVASRAMHAKEWCEEMYLDWSWYTLTKPCVHNERRWWWEFQKDALGFNLYTTCIQLGSTADAHCALWGLEVARDKGKKIDSSAWRIHQTNPRCTMRSGDLVGESFDSGHLHRCIPQCSSEKRWRTRMHS